MEKRFTDVDEVLVAIEKAREHAQEHGKPLNLSRVALYLGMTTTDLYNVVEDYGKSDDERAKAVCNALKMAKQESRADLEDCLADKGNTTGYIFLGKVNHGMVETTRAEVKFKGVRFVGEDEIAD